MNSTLLCTDRAKPADGKSDVLLGYLGLAYALLILYGSLFPFTDWTMPSSPLFRFLVTIPAIERADIVQNVLVYAPLGVLLTLKLQHGRSFARALVLACVAGTALSFFVEGVQQFLPSRVSSLSDLAMNFLGTALGGALSATMSSSTVSGRTLQAWRDANLRPGPTATLTLAVLALWALSQTSPLVPSLDFAHLRHGLAPLKNALLQPETFNIPKFVCYLLNILALGILAIGVVRPGRPALGMVGLLIVMVLLAKVMVVTRQLTPEALLGALGAGLILAPLNRLPHRSLAALAGVALIAAFSVHELAPGDSAQLTPFNWIPFLGQMHGLGGLTDILDFLWPSMALACLYRKHVSIYRRDNVAFIGALLTLALAFGYEWHQQFVPGRYGDVTQVVIALAGWILPWCVRADEA